MACLALPSLGLATDPWFCAGESEGYTDCRACAAEIAECDDTHGNCEWNEDFKAQLKHCLWAYCSGHPACAELAEDCPFCACTFGFGGWGCVSEYSKAATDENYCKNSTDSVRKCLGCSIAKFCSFQGALIYCMAEEIENSIDACLEKCAVSETCDSRYCDCSMFVGP